MPAGKLLFVTDVFPYPLDRGDRVRVLNLLQACARVFEVTLVVARPEASAAQHVPSCVTQVVFVDTERRDASGWRLYLRAMRSGIGLPVGSMVRYRMQFLCALGALDLEQYDVIWAERPHLGRLFTAQCAYTVVDLDDVEHLRLRRLISLQRPSRAWAHNWYRYLVYRRAECRLFRGFLRVVICSQKDQEYLRSRRAGIPWIVPNGAVAPATRPPLRPRTAGEPLRVVFLGNMGHSPNVDAVRFFADEVLTRARGIVASFDVIGPNVGEELRRDYAGRVIFRGFVENLPEALRGYDVMVAPIRFGGGTKLKMIEGMVSGLPLVATPCAAEGLDLVDGTHVLLSASPQGILEMLQRLLQSGELAERIAGQAFSHARERFSWSSIQTALASDLLLASEMAGARRLGGR